MKNPLFLEKTCNINRKYFFQLIVPVICLFMLSVVSLTCTDVSFAAKNKKSLKTHAILKNKKSLTKRKPPALQKKKTTREKLKKIHVTADTMISEKNAGVVEFSGNAVVNDGSSVIKADSIKIFLYTQNQQKNRTKQNKTENIKKIIASGHVRYSSGSKKAFADKAVYTTDSGVIVLTGKAPIVTMGDSFVTGKKITLFRKDSKVIVESGKKRRVEAFFNSKDKYKK